MNYSQIFILFFAFTLSGYCQNTNERPNVVLLISDQHKVAATGAYGSKLAITPNIDELAERGVTFTNCYTPAPVCAPARAALITGMYPYANGAIYHKAPVKMPNGNTKYFSSGMLRETGYHEDIITMPQMFRAEDYATAAPGKMHVHGELQKNVDENYVQGNDLGFDEISIRYYTHFPGGHYEDEVGEDTHMRYRQFKKYKDVFKGGPQHANQEYVSTLVENDEDNFDMVVANKSVDFINRRGQDGKNFFIHVGFEKPHPPFTTTQKYLDMYNPSDFELPETHDDWYKKSKYPWVLDWVHSGIPRNKENAQNVMAAYHACVTQVDDLVGRVVNALKENGLYENTIIIYTSDHGEHLFEHGLRGKHNMYDAASKIPFIVSYPKKFKQNVVEDTNVSLIDLLPTFAELINGQNTPTTQGESLVSLLVDNTEKNPKLQERAIYSEFRGNNYTLFPTPKNIPSRMMKNGDFKFIYTHGIIDQLYDLKADPDELNNLIFSQGHRSVYMDMYFKTLAEWRFQEYSPIKVKLKQNKLSWKNSSDYKEYSLFYAETPDYNKATLVQENITENSVSVSKKGYYWILATPNLTRTTNFYGEEIPVATKDYSYTLPVSDAVEFN